MLRAPDMKSGGPESRSDVQLDLFQIMPFFKHSISLDQSQLVCLLPDETLNRLSLFEFFVLPWSINYANLPCNGASP